MDDKGAKQRSSYQHFILGGTIKAATTSLFNYINAHPQVCGSRIKETFFFSQGYTGTIEADYTKYASYFSPQSDERILFEASPNYLAYKENVASRIKLLFPEVKILFVLRNPVDRLHSYFNFAKGNLQIPEKMSFEEYIGLCEKFNSGQISPSEAGIAEKDLRGLVIGNYGPYLQNYYDVFDTSKIRVIFFDEFNKRPTEILTEICEFIQIDATFYENFSMVKANVTFSARMKVLHYLVLLLNRLLESVFRKRPILKQRLVKIYKYFNQGRQGYIPMQYGTREKLNAYYAPSNAKVKEMLSGQWLPEWVDS